MIDSIISFQVSVSLSKSSNTCRLIILRARMSAQSFRPNSDMNIHQFRRLVKGMIIPEIPGDAKAVQLATSRPAQLRSKSARLIHSPSSVNRLQPKDGGKIYSRQPTSQKFSSWQAIAPYLWNRFAVQHSHSYRPSAKQVPQTFEEALGLPPSDDTIENVTVADEDLSSREETSKCSILKKVF